MSILSSSPSIKNNKYLKKNLFENKTEIKINITNKEKNGIVHEQSPANDQIAPQPTDLRISTMTAICNLNTLVKLDTFYEHLKEYVIETPFTKEGIWFIMHDTKSHGYVDTKRKKKKKQSGFYNQVSVVVYLNMGNDNYKKINIKIFKNGKLQLTGITKDESGHNALTILTNVMNDINKKYKNIMFNVDDEDNEIPMDREIAYTEFKKVMINSDFSTEFKIQRNKLHEILINNYNIYSKFEPCVYQGVNSKYYWNKNYKNLPCKGVCCCTTECCGKGCGEGNGQCKEITIATFQSGKVIITGASSYEQLNSAHSFIMNVFKDHYNDIKRKNIPMIIKPKKEEKKKKEIILIKKNTITFKNKLISL